MELWASANWDIPLYSYPKAEILFLYQEIMFKKSRQVLYKCKIGKRGVESLAEAVNQKSSGRYPLFPRKV